jgi:hypothetical protein
LVSGDKAALRAFKDMKGGGHTAGFKDWERKMKVSGGSSVHLKAELEKAGS